MRRATAQLYRRALRWSVWGGALLVVGLALLLAGGERRDVSPAANNVVNLQIGDAGGPASGTLINLSSYAAAANSLVNGDVKLEWPGSSGLGVQTLSSASVTFNGPSKSITLQGSMTVDGTAFAGIVIFDWDGTEPMPVISLGIKGNIDMTTLNSAWQLEGGAFTIAGFAAISTGEQDLTAIPAASTFYGDRESLGAQLVIEGSMGISNLLPGIGANAGLQVDLTGEFDVDIEALLGGEQAEPSEPGTVSLTGTVAASNLSIPAIPGLTATTFTVKLDLAGEGVDETATADFAVAVEGEVTLNNAAISSAPVTFDVAFRRDGAGTVLEGGLKDGSNWTNPFGVSGVEVNSLRLKMDSPVGGPTTFMITGDAVIGGIGVQASITANNELAVDFAIDAMTVDKVISLFDALGFDVGSLTSINDEIGNIVIGPTKLHFETEAGQLTGAVSTGIGFRGKTATFLLAGGTGPSAGVLAAVQLPSFTLRDLWPSAPAAISSVALPDGGIVISSHAIAKSTFEPGGIEDDFLSEMYCGATTAPADCAYDVPSGVTVAAQMTLDAGIREALGMLGPLSNSPVRVEGTLPVFGPGDMSLKLTLPKIVPTPGSASAEWLKEARLSIEMKVTTGNLSVKLKGAMDTQLPDETEADKFDEVTFSVDAAISVGTKGIGITIGAEIGTWPTPFGIDWIDLNAFRLEVVIKVAPQPGIQVGLAASATLKSACAAFGGSGCPPPSTFNASFVIGVAAGAPVQVDFGFRMFADAIYLRDVAAIAKEMGATGINPSALPNASLRNVEFAFSTINAPSLCLNQGLVIGANVYLDSPLNSAGPGAQPDRRLCSDTSITPAEGIASCQSDSNCFAHMRLKVSDEGIVASAALGTVNLNPVTISGASASLILTTTQQEFTLAGTVSIAGLGSAQGSVSITNTGFAFSLTVADEDPTGNLFTIQGSAGLNAGEPGVFFNLRIFVRLPGLNTAIDGVQDVLDELSVAFTGEPVETRYHLRCIEANVALAFGASDPISGNVNVKVHFVAQRQIAPIYNQGKVWQIGWDFDASLASNVAGLVGSLSGNTSIDEIGCGYEPTATRMNTGALTGISTQATASYFTTTSITASWVSTDYAAYTVTLDMADGRPARVVAQQQYAVNSVISITGSAIYRNSDQGYDRRTAVARVRLGGANGPVVGVISLPILVGNGYPSGYSLSTPAPVNEGGTVSMTATWTDPVPTGGNIRMRSEFTYTIYSLTNTSGTQVQASFANGPISTYPTGSTRSHTFTLPIPARCGCVVDVTHVLRDNLGIVRADNRLITVNAGKPVVTNVTVDGSGADPANGGLLSTARVTFTDPRGLSGNYEVWVNNAPQTTTQISPGVAQINLSTYYQSGQLVPLTFQIRAPSDGQHHRSNAFQRNVVFRPTNSDVNLPEFVELEVGQKAPEVLGGSTVSPLASDDGVANPFGGADCGAIWYYYSPATTGAVRIDTDGSSTFAARVGGATTQELAIAVYEDGTLLTQILPDGNRNITSYPQTLTFDAQFGSNYRIAVAASDMPVGCAQDLTVSGPVVLSFTPLNPAPLQDTVLGSLEQSTEGSEFLLVEGGINPLTNPTASTVLDDAISDTYDTWTVGVPGFDACFDDELEQTVWYQLTSSQYTPGQALDAFVVSSADVQLAVFKDTNTGLQLEGCNEESPLAEVIATDNPVPPAVTFAPTDGDYYLMVDTHGRQDAEIQIYVSGRAASPLNPLPLVSGAPATEVDNTLSSAYFGVDELDCSIATIAHNTWFLWTAPSADPVDVYAGGGTDVKLAAFTVTGAAEMIGCEDQPGSRPETLRLNPTEGQSYWILAASAVGDPGIFEISLTPRGDLRVNEVRNDTFPMRVQVNNATATSDGLTTSCGWTDGASLHFGVFMPDTAMSQGIDIDIDTIGSAIDTRLVVSNVAEEVGCNDDIDFAGGNAASRVRPDGVFRNENAFADLYVVVDGFNGATGDIAFNVTTRGDDIANAVLLAGAPASITLNNLYATVEPDEQRGQCTYQGDAVGHTVWVKWTAPTSRHYTATALGFDSQVTVYENVNGKPGDIVGCGEDELPGLVASARFPAPAGQSYLIQVDGYANTTGDAAITIADDGAIDADGDTIDDNIDNCLGLANSTQADTDTDGLGDACDPEPAFRSIVPARLVDTRSGGVTIDGQFQKGGARTANSVYQVQIGNRGGVPANAVAAILNVTTVSPAGNGYATVFPCNVAQPPTSSINFAAGRVDANEIVAKLDGSGQVCIFVSRATHVLVDAVGYVSPTSPYVAIEPARYADTRSGAAIVTLDNQYKSAGMRTAGSTYEVQIANRGAVPADATAVVMNLTVTGATAGGFATVYPCGTRPDASSANWTTNLTRPNELIVKLSPSGSVCVYVSAPTHLILDVVGYLPPTQGYTPITPARLTDTRTGKTTIDGLQVGDGVRPNGNIYQVQVAGRGGVPLTATSAAINVSVIAASGGYLTVYPCGDLPTASSLNFATGNVRPNELVAKLSPEGRVCVFVSGSAHLLVDVVGYS